MTDEKDENNLLDSLRYYSSIIGVVCMGVHVVVDGPLSMALLTSILYTLTFNYGSSSNYHVPSLRDTWKKFKLKTILNVFGTTQLALLRIALISLQDMEGEKAVTLFLAYVQLLIAFTDNFTVLCRLEQPEPVRPVLRRDYTRYAPAGKRMAPNHLLPIVVCSLAVVVLFLWLSSEHKQNQRILYSHLMHQRRIRLSPGKHLEHQEKKDYCDPAFTVISSLKNGVITVNRTDVDCFGRCIEASKEYREANVLKPWEDIEYTVFTCETVEVVCLAENDPERIEYRMLHRQFLNVRDFTSEPRSPKGKNILVFFVDKMSHRDEFLPKTVDLLEETMHEVTGVGDKKGELRKIPILYGIFTGLLNKNKRRAELCTMFLGNETVGSENLFETATREGYVTMFNDDSFRGIFNSLGCPQATEHLVDHTLEYFYTYTWNNWFMKYIFHGKGCHFTYRYTLDLIREVWQAYPDRPIFALNLISSLSPRKKWLPSIFDQDLLEFLRGLPLSETMIVLANLSGSESEFRIFKA